MGGTQKEYNGKKKKKLVELFAGVGGFRLGLPDYECVAYSEINKHAKQVYTENFREGVNLGDITQVRQLPPCDIVVGGVPCQPWSIAGKRLGFKDPRGKLWFDVIRLVRKSRPEAFIFENVFGLLQKTHIKSFQWILKQFSDMGYHVSYQVYNSKDFGVPQQRRRVYIVGRLSKPVVLPESITPPVPLYSLIKDLPRSPNSNTYTMCDISTGNGDTTIHSWDLMKLNPRLSELCKSLSDRYKKSKMNPIEVDICDDITTLLNLKILTQVEGKVRIKNTHPLMGINGISNLVAPGSTCVPTITTHSGNVICIITSNIPDNITRTEVVDLVHQGQYRRLTGRDCAILQGFPDWFKLPKADEVSRRLLGNAVTVPVIEHIGRQLQ